MKSYISKIRELTNTLILNSLLLKDKKKWNLMCGSLDAIESAQMAVDAYNGLNKDNVKNTGFEYLIIYGLFQALYVQQDSVANLCKSMGISLPDFKTKYPELYEVRQLRNKGFGHPTPNKKDETKDTHSILVEDFQRGIVKLYSYTEAGKFSGVTTYKISDCIEKQNQTLCGIAQQVIEKMKSMEQEHKDKHMQTKLRGCFPSNPQDCTGKIFEAINLIEVKNQGESEPQRIGREGGISLALLHINTLIKAVDKFNGEFIARGLQDNFVCYEIEYSKYPLEKLKEYFGPTSKSSINSQDARAYADSAEIHLLELIKHAENLDRIYSTN